MRVSSLTKISGFQKVIGLLLAVALLVPVAPAFAHGEDVYGPHGGFIRMPGSFHTEVTKSSDQKLKIYLLDMAWKNPTVVNSTVEATIETKKNSVILSCATQADFFECTLPKGASLKNGGTLIVKAVRDRVEGMPAHYPIPFKLKK